MSHSLLPTRQLCLQWKHSTICWPVRRGRSWLKCQRQCNVDDNAEEAPRAWQHRCGCPLVACGVRIRYIRPVWVNSPNMIHLSSFRHCVKCWTEDTPSIYYDWAPQSSAFRFNAYRDFLPSHSSNPLIAFEHFSLSMMIWNSKSRPKQTKYASIPSMQVCMHAKTNKQTKQYKQRNKQANKQINKGVRECKGVQGDTMGFKGMQWGPLVIQVDAGEMQCTMG